MCHNKRRRIPSIRRTSLKLSKSPNRIPVSLRYVCNLCLMHRMDRLNCLDFKDQAVYDNNVHFKTAIEQAPFVDHRQRLLPGKRNTSLSKFIA